MENSTVQRGIVLLVLVTCSMLLLWWLAPKGGDRGGWQVTAVHGGDMITVERDGETHDVHLFGIWAPAVGACGFEESLTALADAIGGAEVALETYVSDANGPEGEPSAAVDAQWERYVAYEGRDVGLAQIETGHAVASGEVHDRSEAYRAAQNTARDANLYVCD